MSKASKTVAKRVIKTSVSQSVDKAGFDVPTCLARSNVYKRVPSRVRSQLDEAIVLRPDGCASLEAIADKFQLGRRYKVSLSSLRSYARKLEEFVRPAMTSQLMAEILGCLPDSYRQQVVAGGQVMLLSKVLQALSIDRGSALTVAELARLASVLSGVSSRGNMGRTAASGYHDGEKGEQTDTDTDSTSPNKMAEAVRMLYGLPWPPREAN
ncbi:MAG: hypothetical protein JSV03_09020 [Planctomycetota bacterium]|nr:MAG: hypothetical protein JSV03_09020 [Planctomycetota bacterium]